MIGPKRDSDKSLVDRAGDTAGQFVRGGITVVWLLAAAALIRFWDLTMRVHGFLLWTAVFIAIFAAAIVALRRADLSDGARPWSDVALWCALLVLASITALIFPEIAIGDLWFETAVFFRVLDIVIPLWILLRGMYMTWPGRIGIAATVAVPIYLLAVFWLISVRMPGESYHGPLPPLTPDEIAIQGNVQRHVAFLSDTIGSRGTASYENVRRTVEYMRAVLTKSGYNVAELEYHTNNQRHVNLQVTIPGRSRAQELVIVGAHYDTYDGTPGADDNATGVAAVLELARLMSDTKPERTIAFVLFGTEEPPFFGTPAMGSRVYARRARAAQQRIVAMYSLEMLGYFSEQAGSQSHPPPLQLFFPDRGNFVAFVGNPASGALLKRSVKRFRESTSFPSEAIVAPSAVPGVELSDHASFWRHGFPAVLVTNTGPFRNDNYHRPSDTSATLDFGRMARVITGMERVVAHVAGVQRM